MPIFAIAPRTQNNEQDGRKNVTDLAYTFRSEDDAESASELKPGMTQNWRKSEAAIKETKPFPLQKNRHGIVIWGFLLFQLDRLLSRARAGP